MSRRGPPGAVLALALLTACAEDQPPANPDGTGTSGRTLDEAEKDAIRGFWKAFRDAEALRRAGRWEDALPVYRQALDHDPHHDGVLYHMANCLIELGRFAQALVPLEELVQNHPLSQRGHVQIGLIRSSPEAGDVFDLAAAEVALERAVEINQEETGTLLRLAAVKLVSGDPERAIELYALANQSNFRAVEGYYVRAFLAWKEGDLESAAMLMEQAIEQSGKPLVVAGVPGEGDTREDAVLPPSTMDDKRLIRAFWDGLAERRPGAHQLETEFAGLDDWLDQLRQRVGSDSSRTGR